jgi:glutamine---fructose-6-phosphate transaminase (isomerizing)
MNNRELLQNGKSNSSNESTGKQGNHTLHEILTQPAAWQAALEVVKAKQATLRKLWEEGQFSEILVTGCGSTYYLSLAAAPLLQQQLGKRARAVPASELLLFPETVMPSPGSTPLLVTISRSGRTTETIRATQAYKTRQKGPMLNIGCYEETELEIGRAHV